MRYLNHIWIFKPVWVTVLAFLVPLKLLTNTSPEFEAQSRCAYVIIVMAILWLTEAIPIPVTALMPIFLFPLLGVEAAKNVSGSYVTDTTMLFLGGLIIAVALEETGLHTRISLCVMLVVGAQPIAIMAGLMATTWFLSMWISNTAATSMMIPIISAVIKTVNKTRRQPRPPIHFNKAYDDTEDIPANGKIDIVVSPQSQSVEYTVKDDVGAESSDDEDYDDEGEEESPEMKRYAKAFALSVAYGANMGGIATLTGTPPNLVLKENADELYASYNYNGTESLVPFAKWMGFAFPLALITSVIGWAWLSLMFIRGGCFKRTPKAERDAINKTIRKQFKKLGFITLAEFEVLVVFVLLVFLWLFQAPPNVKGWGDMEVFKPGYLSDSTPCILLSVLLFLLPKGVPQIFCFLKEGLPHYDPILTWQRVVNKLPWGVIVLLGGGFAIANASKNSGLSKWVGDTLGAFAHLDQWVLNLIVCLIVAAVTEVTSNTATATLLMPILSQMGISTGTHPLYLMISACVACSFAFMLPVATPPNAIVFSTGYLTIPDMAAAGIPMNIIAVLCLTLAINTWGVNMWDLDVMPDIFLPKTTAMPPMLFNTTNATTAG